MLIIIFCQVTLYCETRRQEKQIAAQQVSLEARQKFLKEKKALKVTTTVLFFLILSYLHVIVCRILVSVVNSVNAEFVAFFIACFLLILNSLINPIIYCLRIRQFRVAFIEIVFCKNNFHAENIEMRVFGTRNAVLPALGEAEAGLKGQNNDQENSNSSNNNHSRATVSTTRAATVKPKTATQAAATATTVGASTTKNTEENNYNYNSHNSNNRRSINDQKHWRKQLQLQQPRPQSRTATTADTVNEWTNESKTPNERINSELMRESTKEWPGQLFNSLFQAFRL